MNIETVKLQNSGWLVNGTMSVPNDPANTDCAAVLEWIADDNTPDPEFTDAEIVANAQAVINSDSLEYLNSTDWYITRHAETAVAVPSDIATLRTAAREAIV